MRHVQSEPRHHACTLFDLVLDAIILDQDTGNSAVGEAMRLEYGESLAAGIMRAAGIRRLRQQIDLKQEVEKITGTQVPTGAPSQIEIDAGENPASAGASFGWDGKAGSRDPSG